MRITQALDLVFYYDSTHKSMAYLWNLDHELIFRSLTESGMMTLRKRRLPLEMMAWCIVDLALDRTADCTQKKAGSAIS